MNSYPQISDAFEVVAQSSWMLAVALLLIVGSELATAAMRAKTRVPVLSTSGMLLRGALDEASSVKLAVRSTPSDQDSGGSQSRQGKPTSPISLVVSLGIGAFGAIAIALSGHAPDHGISLLAVVAALGVGAVLAARAIKASLKERTRVQSATRAVASLLVAEASLMVVLVVSLAVVAHTVNLNALSFAEAVAIACCTMLAVRLGPLPRGLITADIVFVVPLTWIGVPLHVALASVLIWRLGTFIVVAVATAVTRATTPVSMRKTPERDRGRILHRASFGLISMLPARLAQSTRATVFDVMFSRSGDPWGYTSNAYESRKREQLLSAVGREPTCILEVGCANGHNLLALAERFPAAIIIGTDVSPRAMESARAFTSHLTNVVIMETTMVNSHVLEKFDGVDCVVVSEILYYLGSESDVHANLGYLEAIARPNCRIVMVHGSADAAQLHERMTRALGLLNVMDRIIKDPVRPYMLSTANISSVNHNVGRYLTAPESNVEILVRIAQRSDAQAMARLHVNEFPLSLYARMGERFMTALYKQWMSAQGSFATVAMGDRSLAGFAVGTHRTYACRPRDLVFSTFIGIPALAMRPHLWKRAALHYARIIRRKLRGGLRHGDSELTFIAVNPEHRQRGIGSELLEAFEKHARECGLGRCTLVTEETNEVGRIFYAHRGWREVNSTRSADGRPLVRLEMEPDRP